MDRNTITEIHLSTVKDFYSKHEVLFDVAIDAVVKGCVGQYYFDNETHKFIGTVTSFDGNESYEVEITVTDELDIGAAFCNCPERKMCYHIGALALNTGYETPIFSCQCTSNNERDDSDSSECAPQPIQEVYLKMEMLDPIQSSEPTDSLNNPLSALKGSSPFVHVKIESGKDFLSSNVQKPETTNGKPKLKIKSVLSICEICNKIFKYSHQLKTHLHKMHTFAIPMYQCAICSSQKHNKRDLDTHMRMEHTDNECKICRLLFLTPARRQRHMNNIHGVSQQ